MQGQLISPGVQESPESLPGTYRAPVTIEIRSPGQLPCLCHETQVWFELADVPEGIEATFEPQSFTIEWIEVYQEQGSPAGETSRTVDLTLAVPASYEGQQDQTITIEGHAANSGAVQGIDVAPTQLTLSFPAAGEASEAPDGPSSEPSGQEDASAGERPDETGGDARIEQASAPDDEDSSPVPGPGAVAAVLASAVVAWRRRV